MMRCPTCKAEGREHTVHEGMSSTTCMYGGPGYWNERDEWVPPANVNARTTSYWCSNGHQWQTSEPCP